MIDRPTQILNLLRQKGDQGISVKECMELGGGTELRKNITTLIRDGHNITSKWKNVNGFRFKRYYLNGKQTELTNRYEEMKLEFGMT